MKLNSRGPGVYALQTILGLQADGIFGPKTQAAVIEAQKQLGIKADGIVGNITWGSLTKPKSKTKVTCINKVTAQKIFPEKGNRWQKAVARAHNNFGNYLQTACKETGIEYPVGLAIAAVEAAGEAHGPDGRMIIRFENHIFKRYIPKKVYNQYFKHNKDEAWKGHAYRTTPTGPWIKQHTGSQDNEWDAFKFACSINEEAAMMSISMGAPQMMGFNHRVCGYETVKEMFEMFNASSKAQVFAMFDFIRHKPNMYGGALIKDFLTFATIYNGPGQPEVYNEWLTAAYNAAKEMIK